MSEIFCSKKEEIISPSEIDEILEKRRFQLFLKRVFDILFALVGLVILFSLFLVVSLVIKMDSKGPVFFTQIRYGKKGKEFRVFKFRTMYVNSSIGNLKAPEKGDKRVTKIGWFLRKTSIDELPQLINVLLGDMSIIGPRAVPHKEIELRLEKLNNEYPEDVDLHEKYMKVRELVRPGITGMAQAYGRSSLTTMEATKYDVYYVENFSLLLDLKIIIKTIQTVIFQKGVN